MKRTRIMAGLMIACVLILGIHGASADFTWPEGLKEIGEEAFAGNTVISEMTIPSHVMKIGAGAFASCGGLNRVAIPAEVEEIGEGAFEDCGEALLIQCEPGSEAWKFAVENQVDYRADTVCRALVIGQTYSGTSLALQGPANDMRAMRQCLSVMGWSVQAKSSLSVSEIRSAISTAFSAATAEDISLFYYSGHGKGLRLWKRDSTGKRHTSESSYVSGGEGRHVERI